MAAVAAQAMREARPTREALVLIVDDDPVFRRFVAAALERASTIRLDAHVVGSLAEAEAVLGSVRYDCVLLDLELPDSQGVETVRRMLAIASDVPVVILTGTEPTDADEDILQAGAQDFVAKATVAPSTLEAVVRHAIDRGVWAARLAATNKQLAARNRDLDDFTHVVSHDLKAPLRGIHRCIDAARSEPSATPAVRGHLEEAAARIERALELVDGMLRLAQAGRRAVGPPVAVGPLLHRVVGSLDVPAGFRIEWPDPGPTVLGDADALGQVFRNLLDNAIKHHDRSDGTVRITARERGAQHEFCVTDDGPGIPLPMHATLFQPFQPGARGTGLGLALVRQAVEAQGGTICAEPAPPRGLTLRFTWPREAA